MTISLSFIGMLLATVFLIFSGIMLVITRIVTKKLLQQPPDQRTIEIIKKIRKSSRVSLFVTLIVGITCFSLVVIILTYSPTSKFIVWIIPPVIACAILQLSGYYSSEKLLKLELGRLERQVHRKER